MGLVILVVDFVCFIKSKNEISSVKMRLIACIDSQPSPAGMESNPLYKFTRIIVNSSLTTTITKQQA